MTNNKIILLGIFAFIIFIIPSVYAQYSWLCLERGDSPPPPYEGDFVCRYEVCVLCMGGDGRWIANPQNCEDQSYDCNEGGGGGSDQEPPHLTVFSPTENGLYGDDSVQVNLEVDFPSDIFYNAGDGWRTVCRNCLSYNRPKFFDDGINNLVFKAVKLKNDLIT